MIEDDRQNNRPWHLIDTHDTNFPKSKKDGIIVICDQKLTWLPSFIKIGAFLVFDIRKKNVLNMGQNSLVHTTILTPGIRLSSLVFPCAGSSSIIDTLPLIQTCYLFLMCTPLYQLESFTLPVVPKMADKWGRVGVRRGAQEGSSDYQNKDKQEI